MANVTTKEPSKLDFEQNIKNAANDQDKTIATSGFINAKIGHAIERTAVSPVVDDFSYYDGATLLYVIRITWTTSAKNDFTRTERIA